MDAFSRELGTEQGRIQPAGFTPAAGDYVFCLGFDEDGQVEDLDKLDYCEASQTADFDNVKVVTVQVRMRAPDTLPGVFDSYWDFQVLIDGSLRVSRRVTRDRNLVALSFSVADLAPGNHSLTLRLKREAV